MPDHLLYEFGMMDCVPYVTAHLYKSSHKRFEIDYKNISRLLYPALSEALIRQDRTHSTSVSGEYLRNIREDSKRQCFRKQLYNRTKVKAKTFGESLLNRSWP